MHCKAFGIGENFDMHSLKQVYIYDMSVAVYGWDQVQSFVWIQISENPDFQRLVLTRKTHFKNKVYFGVEP